MNNDAEAAALAATERWTIGDITITKIVELQGWNTLAEWAQTMPQCTPAAIEDLPWLSPAYLRGDRINMSIHAFVVDTGDHTLVIDLGLGNGKVRRWQVADALDTGFLSRLADVAPKVDTVVCTHLHTDHVGGSTTRRDGRWVPTFPDARYCWVRAEHDYWAGYARVPAARETYTDYAQLLLDGPAVYQDSIEPVVNAGLVDWVQAGSTIAPGVTLVATPGHTPGHVSVSIESRGQRAVVTGDLLHSPAQVGHPEWTVLMDATPAAAHAVRQHFLEECADTDTLVLGSHFGTPTGCTVIRQGPDFRLVPVSGQ